MRVCDIEDFDERLKNILSFINFTSSEQEKNSEQTRQDENKI